MESRGALGGLWRGGRSGVELSRGRGVWCGRYCRGGKAAVRGARVRAGTGMGSGGNVGGRGVVLFACGRGGIILMVLGGFGLIWVEWVERGNSVNLII
jgi:hypothetical protein